MKDEADEMECESNVDDDFKLIKFADVPHENALMLSQARKHRTSLFNCGIHGRESHE